MLHLLNVYARSEVWRQSVVYIVKEHIIIRVIFTVLLGITALELIVCFSYIF